MTASLVQGNTVLQVWDNIPNPLVLPNGNQVCAATIGYQNGGFSILSVTYMDTPPDYPASPISQTEVIANNVVQITRTWPSAPIPQTVTKAQACMALYMTPSPANTAQTMLDVVNAAVATAGPPVTLWWQYASTIDRDSTSVLGLANTLSLSSTQLDDLFTLANGLSG